MRPDMSNPPITRPRLNSPITYIPRIISNVMGLAAEAEIGAAYINGQDYVPMRTLLLELGHPQPATPIQVDRSTANGFANNTIKQKLSKAIDMRFYWIRDRTSQGQFLIYWQPVITNLGNYHTNHHSPSHHQFMQTDVPAHNRTLSALRHCAHSVRVCQFPSSHNCETQIFFSNNMHKTPVMSQTSVLRPTHKIFTRVPDVCPSTNAETIDSSPRHLSFDRRINY